MDNLSLIEISDWLGFNTDSIKLSRMEQISDDNKIFIALWGHYSAGKSRLINSILKRDLLPVQTRETTAVLTYIQYGEKEEGHIIYKSGMCKKIKTDEVRDIFENTEASMNIEQIDHIEVFVNNDLLTEGLVLVDTPGINTVIQKHQDIAVDSIEMSGKIIYVLGNSPSNVDKNFIRQIDKCGIDITFVRTKCDRIVATEESTEDAIEKEKNIIIDITGNDDIEFIPISNEESSNWFDNIELIRHELRKISSNLSEEIKISFDKKAKVYALKFKTELLNERERIAELIAGNNSNIQTEIQECQNRLNTLTSLSSSNEEQIRAKVERAKKESQTDIDRMIELTVEKFKKNIQGVVFSPNVKEEAQKLYQKSLEQAIEQIQLILNSHFDLIIEDEQKIISDALGAVSDMDSAPSYTEIQQKNSKVLDLYRSKLLEEKGEFERAVLKNKEARENAENSRNEIDDDQYNEIINSLNEALAEIPSGVALREVESEELQPSEVFKKAGQAIDLALLLLPGDVVFKGLKTAGTSTKIAQALNKTGKVGKALTGSGKLIGKNAKFIDNIRDRAYMLNEVIGKRAYSTKKEKDFVKGIMDKTAQGLSEGYENFKVQKKLGNVLDALSVSYWTEKIGENFNTPPRVEVDVIEQRRRDKIKNEITAEQKKLSEERMRKMKENGVIDSKVKESEEKVKERQRILDRTIKELERREKDIVEESQKESMRNFRTEYTDFFEKSIRQASKDIRQGYFKAAAQNVTLYITIKNNELVDSIEIKKERLEELIESEKNGNEDLELKLSTCDNFLNNLEVILQ